MAKVNWKQPEAFLFDGKNFDELKSHFPQLQKYERKGHTYTVGWPMPGIVPTDPMGFTEALPGFYLIKNDGPDKIVTEEQFKEDYQ